MSSKQTSKPDPRVAKKEVIVTRHKSAQMKRQLRVKDRSMKHITDLLKSPTKDSQSTSKTQAKKTSPKLKQSLLQSIEKVQKLPEKVFRLSKVLRKKVALVRDEEYYPNKRKRNTEVNRVVLKPNHELKLVGGIAGSVKRKCAVPRKATKTKASTKVPSPVYTELSMAEVIQLMEDDLTDEDMMEILTCPSPVWWEDPPDDEYIEDAIFTRSPEPPEPKKKPVDKIEVDEAVLLETNDTVDKRIEITNLDAKSDNFLKKRSKLEGVLGHIKHKTNTRIRQNENNVFNEDIVVLCSGYRKHDKVDLGIKNCRVKNQTLSESDGEEILFHDGSMNVEEFINDLENMDIPIEDDRKSEVIVIDDDGDPSKTSNNKQNDNKQENKKRPKKETIKMKTNSDETLHMLKNVPVLKKYHLDKFASPKSFDSSSSKTSGENQDIDSISDTNVKFLLDEDVDEQNKNTNADETIFKKENNKNQTFEVFKQEYENESTTVYKIIDEMYDHTKTTNHDIISKCSDDKEGKMNDYYKTCKKFNQKKAKRMEVDKSDINRNELSESSASGVNIESDKFMSCEACKPQTKKVSDDKNVKYCLKCSCIFDSTDCIYCIEKSKTNVYKCVSCRIKFCCEAYFKVHALSHMQGLET